MGGNLLKKQDRAPPYTATYQPGDPEYGQGGGDFFFFVVAPVVWGYSCECHGTPVFVLAVLQAFEQGALRYIW